MHTFLLICPRKQLCVTEFTFLCLIAIFVLESTWLFFCVSESTKNEILQDGIVFLTVHALLKTYRFPVAIKIF